MRTLEKKSKISSVNDPFIDISLPIIEERVSKPVLLGRMSKCRSLQVTDDGQYGDTVTIETTHQPRATQSSSKDKGQLAWGRPGAAVTGGKPEGAESPEASGGEAGGEAGASEGSADADSEASEPSSSPERAGLLPGRGPRGSTSVGGRPAAPRTSQAVRAAEALSELHLSGTVTGPRAAQRDDQPPDAPDLSCSEETHLLAPGPQDAFQTLSHSYVTASRECSVQSCLYQFTSMELLMGNNKLLCENCTAKKQRHRKATSCAEKKAESIYTNARKQLLISAVPAILILHLKRFHQAGLSLRKVNRHVDFPLILDLAPFCSATCKNVSVGDKVLYGLYGVVEHSGSMRGGHYTAYVKVRTPSRKLLEHITGEKNVPGLKEPDSESADQWVHVSDTYVQVVPESRALSAQAYLLFYERIL
ncbi:ubiquitin carboxyl-terminal hydrolase 45 isoform X3 [Canis lupus baileyi]|uniref:ubiquitin carboxyl-terminal hydrolase 45 isoform X3 n=1 Tax=Canis lupus baileyi TaxID=143281 RepID=UPI003B96F1F8